MKTILAKMSSIATAVVALIAAGIVTGLGLTVLAIMTVIGLSCLGLALLVLPFVKPGDMQQRFAHGNRFRRQAPFA